MLTAQDGSSKRRVKVQDLIRDALVVCGAGVPQESSSRKRGEAAGRCIPEDRERKREWSEEKGADGTGKLKRAVAKTAERTEGQATTCLGASNDKQRTRIGVDRAFDQCDSGTQLIHWLFFFAFVDQYDPIIRLIHWLVCSLVSVSLYLSVLILLLNHAKHFFPRMAACVLYLACPWLNNRKIFFFFFKFALCPDSLRGFSERSHVSNRGAEEHQSSKHGCASGRPSENCCNVAEGIEGLSSEHSCGSWFFELPDSPPDQDNGNSEMSEWCHVRDPSQAKVR